MTITERLHSLLAPARKFQQDLLNSFPTRRYATLQLVEALASAEKPTSIVELCQEGAFQRTFSNVHKAIDGMSTSRTKAIDPIFSLEQTHLWTKTFAKYMPNETQRHFKLFAMDATPDPRPYAQALQDRTFVHLAGQFGTPITVGLQASVLVAIPEKKECEAKWSLPLTIERIPSHETPCQTGERQLKELARLIDKSILCVITVDCAYTHMSPQASNQVMIARSRADRTGRREYRTDAESTHRGRPKKYQDHIIRFAEVIPVDEEGGADEEQEYEDVHNGKQVSILISRWRGVYIHGQNAPVDVVKVEIFLKDDPTRTLFENPLLLLVVGERRAELTSWDIYKSYLCRFDIEHFFRFQKRQLLFNSYQTPELHRQVNWWWLCFMAYWLLYLVREATPESHKPWMPKRDPHRTASPGEVKRVFGSKIFPYLGSPSSKPVSRGKSPGRAKGVRLPKRQRYKPIKKGGTQPQAA